MKKNYLLVTAFLLILLTGFSQEEEVNEACVDPSKKTMKYIEAAKSAGNVQEVIDNFNKAIATSPDNAKAYYEYAMYAYTKGNEYYASEMTPQKGNRSFQTSEEMFMKVLELCPEYHAGVYYHLGVINFTQEDRETAKKHFQSFLDYKNMDNNRFPNDVMKMKRDVKEVLKQWEEDDKLTSEMVPYKPFKVPNVSTQNEEYFPMISPDNELMFFTRKLDRSTLDDRFIKRIVEEMTFSQRPTVKENFDTGEPFKKPFNDGTFTSYGAATMSVDNKEMIVCACKKTMVAGQDYLNCDLYQTKYTRSGAGGNDFNWSPLENLGTNINTPNGWEGQPSLSADGQTLYFTAMRGNTRDNDIFISKRNPDGTWGLALPFVEINTEGKDKSPFIHQDDETFYFVSTCTDERKGAGGLDIFYIRKQEDGSWSKPKNIGIPINTPEDELGIFVSTEGSIAYFSSQKGGNWNIYGFELYMEARPESVVILKGTLEDEEGNPIQGAEIEVTYDGGEDENGESKPTEVQKFKVNGDDGKYAAVVKTGKKKDVVLAAKKEDHAFSATFIAKEEIQEAVKEKAVSVKGKDLAVQKLKVGGTYEIADIFYQTNSAELARSSRMILNQFATYLQDNPGLSVTIQGHTDDVGDDQQNLLLSQQRADVVKNFLIQKGVNKARLKSIGFGETQPRVENDSEENRAKNRRTEFKIEKL